MSPRESIYQYTNTVTGMTFFGTEINANNLLAQIDAVKKNWEKEYIAEVWQITGEFPKIS